MKFLASAKKPPKYKLYHALNNKLPILLNMSNKSFIPGHNEESMATPL